MRRIVTALSILPSRKMDDDNRDEIEFKTMTTPTRQQTRPFMGQTEEPATVTTQLQKTRQEEEEEEDYYLLFIAP